MTDTFTAISDALNASRDATAPRDVPARDGPGLERGAGDQEGPNEGNGPEGPTRTADRRSTERGEGAQGAQSVAEELQSADCGAPSPRPGHGAKPGSQEPETEEEKAGGNNGDCPPQCKPTGGWPDDREDGGAGPPATAGGPQDGGDPPPALPDDPSPWKEGQG